MSKGYQVITLLRNRGLRACATAAILINALVGCSNNDEYSEPLVSFATDIEPVELYIQNRYGEGTILKVPAAYMKWRDNREGGVAGNVAIQTAYPEMTPFSLLTAEEREHLEANGDTNAPPKFYAGILLERGVFRNIERAFTRQLQSMKSSPAAPEGGFIIYRVDGFGGPFDYLVPTDLEQGPAGQGYTDFSCKPPSDNGRREGMCRAYVQFSDRMLLSYQIPAASLAQWREIDLNMRVLVNSFIVGCFEGPQLTKGDKPRDIHRCDS